MRVLDIFMVVLTVAGTWSPAMTQYSRTIEEQLVDTLQDIWSNPNSVSASELKTVFAHVEGLVAQICQKNHVQTPYNDWSEISSNVPNCGRTSLALQNIDTDREIASAQSNSNWNPFLNKYCPKSSVLVDCIKHVANNIKYCLQPQGKDFVDALQIIVQLNLKLICHGGGDAIESFLSTGGLRCYFSKIESLFSCLIKVDNDLRFDKILRDSITSTTMSKPILNLDQEACEAIVKQQTCFVRVFRGCENPESADAVDAMFTRFEKLTSCTNSASSSYGSVNSSVISLVSGLLITTAMTMYLRL